MDYEREKKKLEAQHQAAKARLEKEDAKRKALKRQLLATSARLEDRAEKWHRYALAHDDRMHGYTGEQAIARAYLRAMPFDKYVEVVRKHSGDGLIGLVAAELATVKRHFDELTDLGREELLERDRTIYERELAEWQEWHRQYPDKDDWRSRKPSKGQIKLIERIAEERCVEPPQSLNRGEAHDWIDEQGGNPRLTPGGTGPVPMGDV